MTKGTTPTIRWNLKGLSVNDLRIAEMTIQSPNGKRFVHDLSSAVWLEGKLCWTLAQEETLQLAQPVKIQLRFRTSTGYAGASEIYTRDLHEILTGGVL